MPSVHFAGGSAAWAGLISALCGVGRGQPTKSKWVLEGSWALSWGDRGTDSFAHMTSASPSSPLDTWFQGC